MGTSSIWHWLIILMVVAIPAAVALIVVNIVGRSEQQRRKGRDDTPSGPTS